MYYEHANYLAGKEIFLLDKNSTVQDIIIDSI